MRSTLGVLIRPIDKYPTIPTLLQMINKKQKDLTKTFLNLLMFGFLTAEATLKKLVKLFMEKIAIPKF